MPSISLDVPLLKTTDLTKQLRSRDSGQSLLSLLDLAEHILYGTSKDGHIVNVHFPKKEEWLVEWAAQRLKEEEGEGGVEARLSGRFWTFLLELLKRADRAIAARCLRKHGFLQLVGMTMEQCGKRDWVKWKLARRGMGGDGDVEMEDSSATEAKSLPEGDVAQQHQIRPCRTAESTSGLLGDMAAVVEYLQKSSAGTWSGGSVVPVLRGPPELGAQILGSYLENLHRELDGVYEEEEVNKATRGIEAMVGVWKGCVYGNADLKKTSIVFSKTCLFPILKIFSSKIAGSPHIASLEKQVMDNIFAPAFLTSANADASRTKPKAGAPKPPTAQIAGEALEEELSELLSPLRGTGKALNVAEGLGNLMKIGISKAMQSSAGKLTKTEAVERIFASILAVLLGVRLHEGMPHEEKIFLEGHASIIYSLLTIIPQNGLSISDETLRKVVDLAANLPPSRTNDEKSSNNVRWPIIELALTLNFDTFIISQSTSLLDRLVFALSASWNIDTTTLSLDMEDIVGSESAGVGSDEKQRTSTTQAEKSTLRKQRGGLLRIVSLLLEGFLKARDLDGFLAFWRDELQILHTRGGEERVFCSIWTDEGFVAMFSNALERGYLSSKIDKVLANCADSLSQNANLADIFILDAILRGVRREETEERLKNTGTLARVYNILVEGVHMNAPFFAPWLGLQALFRVLQIDNSLLYVEPTSSHVMKGVAKVLEKSSFKSSTELGGLLAAYQIVFLNLHDTSGPHKAEYLAVLERIGVDFKQSRVPSKERWNGAILSLTLSSFPVALLFTIVKRWLRVVELLQASGTSVSFAELFFERAARSLPSNGDSGMITVRDIWDEMLRSGVLFELPQLRDQIVSQLTSKCGQYKPFFLDTVSRFALEAINSRDKVTIARVILDTDSVNNYELINKHRAVMSRLMDQPVPGQRLHEMPDSLLQWFHALNWDVPELRPAQQCTITTGEKILKRTMLNKDQPQNIGYLTKLFTILEKNITETKGVAPSWQLALLCLRHCFSSSTGKVKDGLQALRTKMLEQADAWLEDTQDPRTTATLLPIYGETLFLNAEENETQVTEAGRRTAQILDQWLPQWNNSAITLTQSYKEHLQDVLTGLVHLRCLSPQTPESIDSTTALVIFALTHSSTNPTQKTTILTSFTNMSTKLSLPTYLHALTTFSDTCFPISLSTPQEYYTLMSILLLPTKKPPTPSESSTLITPLSKIYSYLSISLHHCPTHDSFLTLSSCMHTLLRTHPWCISQFNIDETLTSINICTSPGDGPSFPVVSPATPDDIYTSLTRLLLTLLLGHRFRIKGRYHLLIATLQSLLRCLYSPAPYRKKVDKSIHPPWLTSSSSSSTPLLTSLSATSFTRVLTTLCDPAASTVSKHTTSALLTSHTALARKEVARYVPYVMMEHVYWQLQPQRVLLRTEMREALTQGVYALFEVMKSEEGTLKRVSAGLDAQGRALFKRMFEDWGKYGVESLR